MGTISTHDFVYIVQRNFRRHEWAIAYDGLDEGVRCWNESHTNETRNPGGFLLTVCRRRVYDAYRAGTIINERYTYARATNRSAVRRGLPSPVVVCAQTIGSSADDPHGVMSHPTVDDRAAVGVIDFLEDREFIDTRDEIDYQIIRLRLENRSVQQITKSLGIEFAEYTRRVLDLRRSYTAFQRISDARHKAQVHIPHPTRHEKRTGTSLCPPPACRAAYPAEPQPESREPWT